MAAGRAESRGGRMETGYRDPPKHTHGQFNGDIVNEKPSATSGKGIPGLTIEQLRPNCGKLQMTEEEPCSSSHDKAPVSISEWADEMAVAANPTAPSTGNVGDAKEFQHDDHAHGPYDDSRSADFPPTKGPDSRRHVAKTPPLGDLPGDDVAEHHECDEPVGKPGIKLNHQIAYESKDAYSARIPPQCRG